VKNDKYLSAEPYPPNLHSKPPNQDSCACRLVPSQVNKSTQHLFPRFEISWLLRGRILVSFRGWATPLAPSSVRPPLLGRTIVLIRIPIVPRPPLTRSLASHQDAVGASIVEPIRKCHALVEWSIFANRAPGVHFLTPGVADNSSGCSLVRVTEAEADCAHMWPTNFSFLGLTSLITAQCDLVLNHMDYDLGTRLS